MKTLIGNGNDDVDWCERSVFWYDEYQSHDRMMELEQWKIGLLVAYCQTGSADYKDYSEWRTSTHRHRHFRRYHHSCIWIFVFLCCSSMVIFVAASVLPRSHKIREVGRSHTLWDRSIYLSVYWSFLSMLVETVRFIVCILLDTQDMTNVVHSEHSVRPRCKIKVDF